jgi:predicted RNA-binding protein with EMAP domain
LNAVNSAVSTLKQSGSNAQSLGQALNRLAAASKNIDQVKRQRKAGKVLTLQEATQLALAEKQIKDYERELKDICYISGNADLFNRMKQLQAESKQAIEKQEKAIKRKKIQRAQTLEDVGLALAIGVLLLFVMGIFGFIYLAHTGRLN